MVKKRDEDLKSGYFTFAILSLCPGSQRHNTQRLKFAWNTFALPSTCN